MSQPEHEEQAGLFTLAKMHEGRYPLLALLFAIPNGGKRDERTGARMQAEGVKPGVPDVCLPVARGGYHALYIEMKAVYPDGSRGKVSRQQEEWITNLRKEGALVEVCYSWREAWEVIITYLEMGPG